MTARSEAIYRRPPWFSLTFFLLSIIRYWDWSLDWANFQSSPVWDATNGLGDNGFRSQSVGDGRCVTTGPFLGYRGDVLRQRGEPALSLTRFSLGQGTQATGEIDSTRGYRQSYGGGKLRKIRRRNRGKGSHVSKP